MRPRVRFKRHPGRLRGLSRVAISRLSILAEWLGVILFICFILAGLILACVLYPLILCAQWGHRYVRSCQGRRKNNLRVVRIQRPT